METVDEGLKGHMLDAKLAKAVEAEDYAAAAETKAQLEEIMEQDIVLNFTQVCCTSLFFITSCKLRDHPFSFCIQCLGIVLAEILGCGLATQ